MAHSEPQIFSGITPEQFAALSQKAQAAGIPLSGNTGTASKFGVEVSWNYAPAEQQLTLQCLRTPFFVTASEVNAKLQSLVRETLAQA